MPQPARQQRPRPKLQAEPGARAPGVPLRRQQALELLGVVAGHDPRSREQGTSRLSVSGQLEAHAALNVDACLKKRTELQIPQGPAWDGRVRKRDLQHRRLKEVLRSAALWQEAVRHPQARAGVRLVEVQELVASAGWARGTHDTAPRWGPLCLEGTLPQGSALLQLEGCVEHVQQRDQGQGLARLTGAEGKSPRVHGGQRPARLCLVHGNP
mmetsp:Transcript_65469/g.202971  ORF Transcript_65469/g.202971 Transcript_65469/m.202971 type:complete len:212 (+) Transcript_65469:54-689(+)